MLASVKDMLEKAREGKYMVGQFNISNLEWTKSVLLTAEELKSPVILGVSEGTGKYMAGFKTVTIMVRAVIEELNITVPVALHLDHGICDGCYKCIKVGLSSITFGGSYYPIEENVKKTRGLIKIAHVMGLSLEAEIGPIGGEEDGVIGLGECTDPREHKATADLEIDFLAVGTGNICDKYLENWSGLCLDVLEQVKAIVDDMSLVLHGGTGVPEDMIKKAISLGVAKINVNTGCQLSFTTAIREYTEAGEGLRGKGFDPRKLLAPGADATRATTKEKMEPSGPVGKA